MTAKHEPTTAAEHLKETGPRAFSVFLNKVADGDCHSQLSEELLTLSKSLAAQARAQVKIVRGKLVLSLQFEADIDGTLDVTYAIERKEPKPRRPRSVFWIGKDGNVLAENPKQLALGLRAVSRENAPKEAPNEEAQPREV